MNTRKTPRGTLMALCLGALALGACASKPEVRTDTPTPRISGQHGEIKDLEQRIAGRRRGGSSRIAGESAGASDAAPMAQAPEMATSRCDGVCTAAQEICTWHRRICSLAAEINDAASAQSCQRSQRDCETASSACSGCR